ncbi:MAG: DUF1416 domain-containing protein [Acidimicrobiia bacterium]|nr:DUF1416 domain-containing protein [Acidimicrobiia bacterium]
MARITGQVKADGGPAPNAYVQLRDKDNEFCGETRCDDDGHFVLYAVPGSWLLVAWLPAGARTNETIQIVGPDIDVELSLEPISA